MTFEIIVEQHYQEDEFVGIHYSLILNTVGTYFKLLAIEFLLAGRTINGSHLGPKPALCMLVSCIVLQS